MSRDVIFKSLINLVSPIVIRDDMSYKAGLPPSAEGLVRIILGSTEHDRSVCKVLTATQQ